MSKSCVQELNLSVTELQYDLMVSTPTSGLVKTFAVYARCSVIIEGHTFKYYLVYLPLQGLDVILGMNWLFANHIFIDCNQKKLFFTRSEDLK